MSRPAPPRAHAQVDLPCSCSPRARFDTVALLLDEDGVIIARSDDIVGDCADICSSLTATIPPATSYYAVVWACGDATVINRYLFDVSFP